MPELEALAQNVKAIRKELGETQLEFALNCGLSKDEICHIEKQRANPKFSTVQNIAAYTGLTFEDLIKKGD